MEISSLNSSSLSLNIEHYMTIMINDLGILKLLSFFYVSERLSQAEPSESQAPALAQQCRTHSPLTVEKQFMPSMLHLSSDVTKRLLGMCKGPLTVKEEEAFRRGNSAPRIKHTLIFVCRCPCVRQPQARDLSPAQPLERRELLSSPQKDVCIWTTKYLSGA